MGLKILNIVFFVVMVTVNYLANALPINNKTTGELSGQFENLFVPAGMTFSIWGVIYLMLAVFCIIQFHDKYKEIVSAISWLFIASALLNSLWIFAWHYENLPFSIAIMLLLLTTLVLININISEFSYGFFKAVFGIYLGWICIATIANVTAWLVSLNWGGFGISAEIWTIIMIIIGLILTGLVMTRFNNPFAGLAVMWAFVGIAIKQHNDYQIIYIVAIIAAILTAVFVGVMFIKKLV